MVKPGIYTINPEEEKGKKGVEAGVFDEIPIKTDHADTDHIVAVEKGSSGGRCTRRSRCLVIAVASILVLAVGIAAVTMLFARCKSSHDDREAWAMDRAKGEFDHFKDNNDGFFGEGGFFGEDRHHGGEDGSDSSEMDDSNDDDDRRPPHGHAGGHSSHEHGGRSSHEHQHGAPHHPHGPPHGDHGDGDRDGDEGGDGGEMGEGPK